MKKHLAWLLIIAMWFNLAACNVQEEILETDPTVPSYETEQEDSTKTPENEQIQDQEPPETPVPVQPEPEIDPLEINSKTFTEDLFNITGSLDLAYYADGVCYGPYNLMKYTHNMQMNFWEKLIVTEEPDLSECTSWLVLASGDGSAVVTVYETDPIYILYERDGQSRWYQKPEGEVIAKGLRKTFDSLEVDMVGRIRFYSDATGAALLEEYGKTIFPKYRQQLSPGSNYRYSDYELLSCSLFETSEEGVIVGKITYAAIPDSGTIYAFAYLPTEGTGAYEGWWIYEKEVYLQQHHDGMWYEISMRDTGAGIGKRDSEEIKTDQEAVEYLEQLNARLVKIRETDDVRAELLELADLFLRCTTAVSLAGDADFDWRTFCTETALSYTGMKSMLNRFVHHPDIKGFYWGDLNREFSPRAVQLSGEEGWVVLDEITVFFEKVDGQWMICDVSMPW